MKKKVHNEAQDYPESSLPKYGPVKEHMYRKKLKKEMRKNRYQIKRASQHLKQQIRNNILQRTRSKFD